MISLVLTFTFSMKQVLILKMPRKTASEKCRLFMSSAEYSCKLFKPNFAYRQTVWTLIRLLLEEQSDLGPHCLQKWLLDHKQMTKQMTIVVIGSLRVKGYWCTSNYLFTSLLKRSHSTRKEFAPAGSKLFPWRVDSFSEGVLCVGHSEPIVTGLLIGAKKCREARGSYFV